MEIKTLTYYQTDDYSQFKFYEFNRQLTDAKSLQRSIDEVDMTPYVPIIVSPDFYIIDGQNRFEVCKKLGKPITYVIYDGDPEFAMINLNTVIKQWRMADWLSYYCGKGNQTYIRFRDLMAKNELYSANISNSIVAFSQNRTSSKEFNQGKLVDRSEIFEEVFDFVKDCGLSPDISRTKPFITAVMYFLLKYKDNKNKQKRLQKKVIALPKYARYQDYLQAFENLSWRPGETKESTLL